jgi:hypothetical protein
LNADARRGAGHGPSRAGAHGSARGLFHADAVRGAALGLFRSRDQRPNSRFGGALLHYN